MILADFEHVPWVEAAPWLRTKTVEHGGIRARLLELSEGFVEADWCTHRHAFHVLDGACSIATHERTIRIAKGDVGLVPGGGAHAHKLVVGAGERALLMVFDDPVAP